MTTLYDIAKIVGVNPSTVSRALKDSPKVGKDTKSRIRAVAARMGYRQNAVARSLVTQRTSTFGMVMSTLKCMEHTLFSAMLEGISQEVHRMKWYRHADLTQVGKGTEAMRSLLAASQDFTAIFAFSDRAAIEAIRVIQEHGLHVPQDIAVIGFDGANYGELTSPSLTTVKQPYFEIGVEAARMLKRLTTGESLPDNSCFIAPELIIRESCGANCS